MVRDLTLAELYLAPSSVLLLRFEDAAYEEMAHTLNGMYLCPPSRFFLALLPSRVRHLGARSTRSAGAGDRPPCPTSRGRRAVFRWRSACIFVVVDESGRDGGEEDTQVAQGRIECVYFLRASDAFPELRFFCREVMRGISIHEFRCILEWSGALHVPRWLMPLHVYMDLGGF